MVKVATTSIAYEPPEVLWREFPDTLAVSASHGTWVDFPHIRFIADAVRNAALRDRGRLIVNVPPQHGKSQLLSKWVPIWYLERDPRNRVITASYSAELATRFGREVRNELADNPMLQTRLSPDSHAAGRWNTPQGGGMYTTGVGGSLSGFSGDLMIIDDPHKDWQEAFSGTHRRRVTEWFESVFYTRRQKHTSMVILQTRWHPDDLTGYLIEHHPDDWQVICLRALAEGDDPMGREEGEPLCPELHDRGSLEASRASTAVWEALYQQRPTGIGTGRVYDHFTQDNIDNAVTLRDDLELDLSIDYNIRPGMHAVIGQYDPQEDMFTAVDEIHDASMNLEQCIRKFREKYCNPFRWGKLNIFDDPSGRNRSVDDGVSKRTRVARQLDDIPHSFKTGVKHPPLRNSIDAFNSALRDETDGLIHYKINAKTCKRLKIDLKELPADEEGLIDKSDQALSHSSDAERYRVFRLRPMRLSIPRPYAPVITGVG